MSVDPSGIPTVDLRPLAPGAALHRAVAVDLGLGVRRRDGGWIAVPPMPGALICNVGAGLARWTNDVDASTPHRFVSPEGRDRFSVAFFLDADPDVVVPPPPSCIAVGAAPLYTPLTVADHLRARLDSTYGP